jgi:integrase
MRRGPKKLNLGRVKKIPATDFWRAVRDIVLSDPERFRKQTGLRVVDEKPPPSAKLSALLTTYEEKRRKPSDEELKKVRIYWNYFTKKVSPAKTVRNITADELSKWEDAAWSPFQGGGSPKTLHHRFEYVIRVLNYAIKKQLDAVECERVVKDIKSRRAELPDLRNPNPKPISVEDFHKLLEAADARWRTMLLTALNLCYYPIDVRTLPKSAVNLSTGVVIFDRAKTGQTTRVGILWKRTVKALKSLQKAEPHDSEYTFISQYRTLYSAHGFRNTFRQWRNESGLSHVEFQHIRDGAYTAAIEHGASEEHAKILAGHKIRGMSDAYIKRRPKMVTDACAAIEQHYFGKTSQ